VLVLGDGIEVGAGDGDGDGVVEIRERDWCDCRLVGHAEGQYQNHKRKEDTRKRMDPDI